MGARHGNRWKGGRVIASNGYVLVNVGKSHHLADVRGYAYEHRLVAEEKLGRKLLPGEQVHHIDENRQNNDPSNLEIAESVVHHRVHHRTTGTNRRLPGQENQLITCRCGCHQKMQQFDRFGRPRAFISGHTMKVREWPA
jgi:hypothetical protein